jgi:ATP-dependent DNA helicase RecQ
MPGPDLASARAVLSRYFGYPDFRAAQIPAIEATLSRRDAVIVLPTGGGKSICFQVPALCLEGLTVVISPLISLMADQVQALERRDIGATFLNSTLAPDETAARVTRIRSREVRLLYLAPERLAVASTTSLLAEMGVTLLAVDEAHCVSEWGQDFRPSYLRLAALRREFGDPQTVALTATATPRVRADIARLLELRSPVEVIGGFDRPNLTFRVQRERDETTRRQVLVDAVRATPDPVVVYSATRKQVERVARVLQGARVPAVAYHAGLEATRRSRAQDAFMTGSTRVIVATNAFGMGIDKPNVRLVVHYLHSGSLEDYYQEAGRAGRDGERSRCLLLFHHADRRIHDRMREGSRAPEEIVRATWLHLAGASRGRRPVSLDPVAIASLLRPKSDPETVGKAITVLRERAIVTGVAPDESVRLRLLATDLRVACELPHLAAASRTLLVALSTGNEPVSWREIRFAQLGLSAWQAELAVSELESRQLAFADRCPPSAIVAHTISERARLERCLSQLRVRRRAERTKLDAMVGYATTMRCRRAFILGYFGEAVPLDGSCGDCDVCAP